ncbi:MAG: aldo/keto reductase [Thermoproteota archaeon]
MEYKYFKKLGREVPALGAGTWGIGGGYWSKDTSEDKEAILTLRTGIELGITLIDTAEMYGAGHAEEIVGEAIKGFDREKLFIVTKVWQTHAKKEDVIKSAEASSKRLGTYMDLYLLHWPTSDVPLCETMKAMEELVKKGLVKNIGVSNFSVELIEDARSCLSITDIAAVQNRFSLSYRNDEESVIPYARKEGMMYMAYTPIDKGSVANNRILKQVASKYGKTPIQVALNWLIMIEPVVPIPKASKVEHIKENAGSVGWKLSKEDWDFIKRSFH